MSLQGDGPVRHYRMFKKRVKKLDIFEESDRKNKRVWNMIEDSE